MKPRARAAAALLAVFLVGVACGALLIAALATRASGLHLQMARMTLSSEQERRAVEGLRTGDLGSALIHASCGVVLEESPDALKPSHSPWTLAFPVVGAFVTERTKYPVDDNTRLKALAHAKLAVVWERIGDHERATRELGAAVSISGDGDAGKWRAAGLAVLEGPRN